MVEKLAFVDTLQQAQDGHARAGPGREQRMRGRHVEGGLERRRNERCPRAERGQPRGRSGACNARQIARDVAGERVTRVDRLVRVAGQERGLAAARLAFASRDFDENRVVLRDEPEREAVRRFERNRAPRDADAFDLPAADGYGCASAPMRRRRSRLASG
jgi:hypothetical protein